MRFYDDAYAGRPPWEIGRPQGALVRLAPEIRGSVLDAGCGTGENALFFASRGHEVWGIDRSAVAIARAREKARERGLAATFVEGDALALDGLGGTFDTVVDCGLFHGFGDDERPAYVRSLLAALRRGGTYCLLCFSDREPAFWGGPRRISEDEIRETFAGWQIVRLQRDRFETTIHSRGARAWLATLVRP